MLTKELIEFGLNENEAKAYLALLELEIAGVNEIAKTANIIRSSAYVTLESLKKRGLVSISDDKIVRQYIATPPESLLRLAKDKAQQQENIFKKIESIIPDMKALYKGTKRKPIVRVFEGKEGIIAGFEDTLLNNKEKIVRIFSSPGTNLDQSLVNYIPSYIKKRLDFKIKMKGIHPDDEINRGLVSKSPYKDDEYILIPKKNYKFTADLAIYEDRIGYMTGKDGGNAVIIESKEISDVMKSIFDLAFEEAKRLYEQIKIDGAEK